MGSVLRGGRFSLVVSFKPLFHSESPLSQHPPPPPPLPPPLLNDAPPRAVAAPITAVILVVSPLLFWGVSSSTKYNRKLVMNISPIVVALAHGDSQNLNKLLLKCSIFFDSRVYFGFQLVHGLPADFARNLLPIFGLSARSAPQFFRLKTSEKVEVPGTFSSSWNVLKITNPEDRWLDECECESYNMTLLPLLLLALQ
jgi:hypothetical protein